MTASKHIFLTGATGLVGGALTGALLDAGHKVTALVRGAGRRALDMDGRDRMTAVAQMRGDISLRDFGLRDLPEAVDLVIHCAATTDFTADAQVYQNVNVDGTRHAIGLAKALNAALLQVSTAYVCGRVHGDIAETIADPNAEFTNGYERSKAVAESYVMSAHSDGITAAIARPSIIVGRLEDGAIPRQDDFYHLFRLFGSQLLGEIPASQDTAFAFVPIDHVVVGLMAMVDNMVGFDGHAVHLVADQPFALTDMLAIVGEYPRASPANMVPVHQYNPARLDRRQAVLHRKIGAQFFDYFTRTPRFLARNLEAKSGITSPHIDKAAFRRMVDYCHQTGFLDWR